MNSLMWAVGSMLLALIFIFLLPLGLTKKGKIVVVLISFLLALVGLTATSSFSLWQIVLLLFVLIIFTTYLLNTRLVSFMYKTNDSFGKMLIDKKEPIIDYNKMKEENYEHYNLSRNEVASALDHNENEAILAASIFDTQHDTKQEVEKTEEFSEIEDEDISFLLNRSIEIEEEKSNKENLTDIDHVSDIESLLVLASGEKQDFEKFEEPLQNLKDDDELPILTFDHDLSENDERTETSIPLEKLEELPLLSFEDDDIKKIQVKI
jgi:ABC-type multidrug transport system fused ATPase/permease subunit